MKNPLKRQPKRYVVRYDHEDGNYRTITMRAESAKAAKEIADRRLNEQFSNQNEYEFSSIEAS